jgi:hypothetical protein
MAGISITPFLSLAAQSGAETRQRRLVEITEQGAVAVLEDPELLVGRDLADPGRGDTAGMKAFEQCGQGVVVGRQQVAEAGKGAEPVRPGQVFRLRDALELDAGADRRTFQQHQCGAEQRS